MNKITIVNQTNNNGSIEFDFFDNASGTILRSFTGFEYPDVLSSIEDVAGKGGAHYVNSKFGRRRLSFQGDLVGTDKFSQRREVLAILRQRGALKLFEVTTYDDLLLQFEAEVVRLTMPYTHQIHTFLFELIAPDWRFYSQVEETEEIDPASSIEVVNDGNEITDPEFTIIGPASDIVVTNLSSGEAFSLDITLTGSDTVVIDTVNKTVKVNDVDQYSIFSGDFFSLEPGINDISFAATGYDGITKLSVKFRHAYLGV